MKTPTSWQIGLVLIIGLISVSSAAVFIRLAMEAVETQGVGLSLVLAAGRMAIASLVLLPAWNGFRPGHYSVLSLTYAILAGGCLALHFAVWITSLAYTSIVASTVLVTMNSVWVALLSWCWFKEKPNRLTLWGIAIALSGGIIVGLGNANRADLELTSGSNPPLGNCLALIGSWAISFYLLFARQAQQQGLGIRYYTVLVYSTAALILLPLPFWFSSGYGGYPLVTYGCIVMMALFPQLVGHTSFNWAVRWISPTLITLVILGEPIAASLFGYIFFGEIPGIQVVLGSIVLLSGVVVAAIASQNNQTKP